MECGTKKAQPERKLTSYDVTSLQHLASDVTRTYSKRHSNACHTVSRVAGGPSATSEDGRGPVDSEQSLLGAMYCSNAQICTKNAL
jgi:hypothetical protein